MAELISAMGAMRVVSARLLSVSSSLFVAICYFLGSPAGARAQLWDSPPLPPVKYAAAADGMTLSVGAEQGSCFRLPFCRYTFSR